ncbi:hypothetical protein AYI70_g1363 [Smittium culicis]|uniref:Cullin-associated NEDD8-dissociated protein 1 n=1 Tax=Smittium culicis TaxID=133412 RepID=A0A1R1YCV8_9FUNG|nr:hypothetical protein AYI70_g1363 [Smittium culicis]
MSTQSKIKSLLEQLFVLDHDFRHMAVLDLTNFISIDNNLRSISATPNLLDDIAKSLFKVLNDPIHQVQNLAISCLATLASNSFDSDFLQLMDLALTCALDAAIINDNLVCIAAYKKIIEEVSKNAKKQQILETTFLSPLISKISSVPSTDPEFRRYFEIVFIILKNSTSAELDLEVSTKISDLLLASLINQQSIPARQVISSIATSARKLNFACLNPFLQTLTTNAQNESVDHDQLIFLQAIYNLISNTQINSINDYSPVISLSLNLLDSDNLPTQTQSLQILQSIFEKSSKINITTIESIYNSCKPLICLDLSTNHDFSDTSDTEFDFEDDQFDLDNFDSSDDESWKIRSASTRLICSIIKYAEYYSHTFPDNSFPIKFLYDLAFDRFGDSESVVRSLLLSELTSLVNSISPIKYSRNGYIIDSQEHAKTVFESFTSSCLVKSPPKSAEIIGLELSAFESLLKLSQHHSQPFVHAYVSSLFSSVGNLSTLNLIPNTSNSSFYPPGLNAQILRLINSLYANNSVPGINNDQNQIPGKNLADPTANLPSSEPANLFVLELTLETALVILKGNNSSEAQVSAETVSTILSSLINANIDLKNFSNLNVLVSDTLKASIDIVSSSLDLDLVKKCLLLIPLSLILLKNSVNAIEISSTIETIFKVCNQHNSIKPNSLVTISTILSDPILSHKISNLDIIDPIVISVTNLLDSNPKQLSLTSFKILSQLTNTILSSSVDTITIARFAANFSQIVSKSLDHSLPENDVFACIQFLNLFANKVDQQNIIEISDKILASLIFSSNELTYDTPKLSATLKNTFFQFGSALSLNNAGFEHQLNQFFVSARNYNKVVGSDKSFAAFANCVSSFVGGAISINPSNADSTLQPVLDFALPNLNELINGCSMYCFSTYIAGDLINNHCFSSFKAELANYLGGLVADNQIPNAIEKFSESSINKNNVIESISYAAAKAFSCDYDLVSETLTKAAEHILANQSDNSPYQEILIKSFQTFTNMSCTSSNPCINTQTAHLIVSVVLNLIAEFDLSSIKSAEKCTEWSKVLGNIIFAHPLETVLQIKNHLLDHTKNSEPVEYAVIYSLRYKFEDFVSSGKIDVFRMIYGDAISSSIYRISNAKSSLNTSNYQGQNRPKTELNSLVQTLNSTDASEAVSALHELMISSMFKITNKSVKVSTEALLLASTFIGYISNSSSSCHIGLSLFPNKLYFDAALGFDIQLESLNIGRMDFALWASKLFELAKVNTALIKIEKIGPFSQVTDLGAEIRKLCVSNLDLLFNLFGLELALVNSPDSLAFSKQTSCEDKVLCGKKRDKNGQVIECASSSASASDDENADTVAQLPSSEAEKMIFFDALIEGLNVHDQQIFIDTCNILAKVCACFYSELGTNPASSTSSPANTASSYTNSQPHSSSNNYFLSSSLPLASDSRSISPIFINCKPKIYANSHLVLPTTRCMFTDYIVKFDAAIDKIDGVNSKPSDSKLVTGLLDAAKRNAQKTKNALWNRNI